MKELLDAIDAAIASAQSDKGHDGVIRTQKRDFVPNVVIPPELWEKLCVERAKLEPEAPEMRPTDVFDDVRAFLAIGHPHMLSKEIAFPEMSVQDLCVKLVREEYDELFDAIAYRNIFETADAIADLIWVLICFAFACGIPIERVWEEVARANMAKFPGGVVTRRPEDGKILKPEGWQPPDIIGIFQDVERVRRGEL